MKGNNFNSLNGNRSKWLLTENHQQDEDGGEAGDRIEHELQVASDQVQVVVVLHEHRWQQKANRNAELK